MTDKYSTSIAQTPEISLLNINASYGSRKVLSNISLEIYRGECLAVIGQSASGKSTLLRVLNLLHPLDSGEIFFRQEQIARGAQPLIDVDIFRRKVGLVHQEWNLFPNKTVLGNVTEALRYVLKMPRQQAIESADEWLKRLGVSEVKYRYPSELSGGQKQRVALARALAMEPDVLMLDEITSALDVETIGKLLKLLESLRDGRRTFIFVSHHLDFVSRATDRTVVLIDGEIVEAGDSDEIINHSQNPQVREFLSLVKATK